MAAGGQLPAILLPGVGDGKLVAVVCDDDKDELFQDAETPVPPADQLFALSDGACDQSELHGTTYDGVWIGRGQHRNVYAVGDLNIVAKIQAAYKNANHCELGLRNWPSYRHDAVTQIEDGS